MRRPLALLLVAALLVPHVPVPARADDGSAGFAGALSEVRREVAVERKNAIVPLVLGAAALAALLSGCATVPMTGRRQLMLVPESMMDSMGEDSWREVKRQHRPGGTTYEREMVRRVADRVTRAAGMPGGWEVELFDAPKDVNAFAIPGRKIGIFTGILPYTKDEAGLAAVMGHEVAHVMARHGGERVSQTVGIQLGLVLLDEAVLKRKMKDDPAAAAAIHAAIGVGAVVGVILPFSRSHESEADRMGILIAAKAGYDPRAAVDLWKRMPGGAGAEFLSTHPSHSTRIADLERHMPEALEHYRRASGAGTTR